MMRTDNLTTKENSKDIDISMCKYIYGKSWRGDQTSKNKTNEIFTVYLRKRSVYLCLIGI